MVPVQAGIIAVPAELDLEFNLVALHERTTDRAVSADTWPSPHAVRAAVRQLPGLDHLAGFLTQGALVVHLAGPRAAVQVSSGRNRFVVDRIWPII